ncbi:Probable Bax inhibitor 1, partial [Geodia barretti]
MLFLGGFLISGLNMLVMMLFFNIFLGSHMVFQLDVYGGVILFCGFVLFDTQLIAERFNNGDTDYVRHSLDLFLDFINIFRRLLVILASKCQRVPLSPPLLPLFPLPPCPLLLSPLPL